MNWTVAHGVYVKLKLFNKIYQFQAKRKLRRVFGRQFQGIGQLRTVFWTSISFLSKDAKFKQIDNCAECFDANLEPQDSCAGCFGQVLDFNRSRHFQAERKLRRLFWRQFGATGQLCTVFWTSFSLLTKVAKFKKNDSCAQCFDATFGQQDSCGRCFGQLLARYRKTPSSSKSKVAQSVLTPISINWTVAHVVLNKP